MVPHHAPMTFGGRLRSYGHHTRESLPAPTARGVVGSAGMTPPANLSVPLLCRPRSACQRFKGTGFSVHYAWALRTSVQPPAFRRLPTGFRPSHAGDVNPFLPPCLTSSARYSLFPLWLTISAPRRQSWPRNPTAPEPVLFFSGGTIPNARLAPRVLCVLRGLCG